MQHPPTPLFVPVKAAVTPATDENRPFLGNDVTSEAADGTQTTQVNPFSKAAKGTHSDTQYYTLKGNRGF